MELLGPGSKRMAVQCAAMPCDIQLFSLLKMGVSELGGGAQLSSAFRLSLLRPLA